MNNHKAMLVRATPEYYADPRVRAMAFSYADLYLLAEKEGRYRYESGGPTHLRRMFEGQDIPVKASTLKTMELGPWGNTTGLGMDGGVPLVRGAFVQPERDRLAHGYFRSYNPMDRIAGRHGILWNIRPTLVPTTLRQSHCCTHGYLVASTVSIDGLGHYSDEFKGEVRTVAVPFLFPADNLDVKTFQRFDAVGANALSEMVKYRAVAADGLKEKIVRAETVLANKRAKHNKGRLRVDAIAPANRDWEQMTPRELVNAIKVLETRLEKRDVLTKRNINDMATEMEALSNLMIERLPIAYATVLMQINSLTVRTETNED